MRNLPMNQSNSSEGKELNDFEKLALPFQNRLYRTALILTKSPRHAKELLQQTCADAKQEYHRLEPDANFGAWLSHLLLNHYIRNVNKNGEAKRDDFTRG